MDDLIISVFDEVENFCKEFNMEINFLKFLKFLNTFSIVKRFQTSKNTLEVLKPWDSVPHPASL